MKICLITLIAAALTSQAAVIPFGLSPAGSDAAVGMTPQNEVPPVTTSTGSGGLVSGGIVFDTDNNTLKFAIGYGSASGFTDLMGAATAMHIHLGPPGQSGNPITNLAGFHFPAADPTKGGVILGTLAFPADQVSSLLAGQTYVNIHTSQNPDGEIRGQLVAVVNAPPVVECGSPATVECGTPATVTVMVSDPEGDALSVEWSVNGEVVQTSTVPAGSPSATTPVLFTSTLPLGPNTVSVTVTDSSTNTATCSTLVTVADTTPPTVTAAVANPNVLWPPNHRMVPITLRVQATDTCGSTTWKITGVTSNESTNGLGDGDTAPDWQIIGDHGLKLRAERSGKGNGRTYTVIVRAVDASGNLSAPKSVTVRVPKNQGNGR